MMFRKRETAGAKGRPARTGRKDRQPVSLTAEEIHQMDLEMSWDCWMLFPGGFPNGLWYFF